MVTELGIKQDKVVVHCDNQSAVHLSKHQVLDVKLHFVRDVVSKGEVILKKISTEENPADALTKTLPIAKFKHCK